MTLAIFMEDSKIVTYIMFQIDPHFVNALIVLSTFFIIWLIIIILYACNINNPFISKLY